MAEYTPQQRAVLASTHRHNLVNATFKTGKTILLTRKYLTRQERPGEFRAIFVTPNGFVTQRVLDHLQRITNLSWQDQLIGTLQEISYKLLQRYYADLSYSRVPKLISDNAATVDRNLARQSALKVQADQFSAAFLEQWNQDYVERLRRKDLATPRSLLLELVNMFTRLTHASLTNVKLLVADNVHDYTLEEIAALTAIQERMQQSFLSGNTNWAIADRSQNVDPENWLTLARADIKTFALPHCFGISPAMGLFTHQISNFNSKRIYESSLAFLGSEASQVVYEVTAPNRAAMLNYMLELEEKLQLGIKNRTLGVIMRNVDDAREMAKLLNKPYFIMWDRSRLLHRFDPPVKGIVCTTPYEAPYLNLDFVAVPSCLNGYWPYKAERNAEQCRRQFVRSVGAARIGAFLLLPDPASQVLPSPFISEGNNPKLVTKTLSITSNLST